MKPIAAQGDVSSPATSSPSSPFSSGHDERAKREVRCPTCQKLFIYGESKFRPFCSERCKMIDLGRWFKEEYTVAAVDQTPPDEEQISSTTAAGDDD